MNCRNQGKLSRLILLLTLATTLAGSQSVSGSVFRSDSGNVIISNLHIIDDDLYVFAKALDADGEITGDLFGFAYRQVVRGTVANSANLFGRHLSNRGIIQGSFRAFGETIDIDGEINGSAILCGSEINISPAAKIGRDLHAAGGRITVNGEVGGKVVLRAEEIVLAGRIDSEVDLRASKITIMSSATINGNVNYTSLAEDALTIEPGADVRGDLIWHEKVKDEENWGATWLAVQISTTLAAFLFGLVVVRLFRPYAEESFKQLKEKSLASFAAGLVGLVAFSVSLIILVLAIMFLVSGSFMLDSDTTVILGLLLVVFSTLALPLSAFIGVTGWIILYSGKIVVAFLIGSVLIGMIKKGATPLKAGSLLLGLVILLILFSIPWLGLPIYLAAVVSGAGAILLGIRHCRKDRLEAMVQSDTAQEN